MNRMTITAANTMNQLQKQLDVISHNIANLQTTGYKKQKATFSELMYQQHNNQMNTQAEIGRLTPYGVRMGTGAKIDQIQTVLTQGPIVNTGRALDFALTKPDQFLKSWLQGGMSYKFIIPGTGNFISRPSARRNRPLLPAMDIKYWMKTTIPSFFIEI